MFDARTYDRKRFLGTAAMTTAAMTMAAGPVGLSAAADAHASSVPPAAPSTLKPGQPGTTTGSHVGGDDHGRD